MMSTKGKGVRNHSGRYPFAATQWQELEHQALVYKYMISSMPIPPGLLFTIKTSLDSLTFLYYFTKRSKPFQHVKLLPFVN
ncbi:putative transcription factor interactor and regulator C3H-WRC/GRF family [Helianthus annuus]|nr:putative transcription factor interactor and regulator C3H-WRC/GRF family [Helianthus annuus]